MTPTATAVAAARDIVNAFDRGQFDTFGVGDIAAIIDAAGVAALTAERDRLREACEAARAFFRERVSNEVYLDAMNSGLPALISAALKGTK
jgi:hypothetical protein